MRILNPLVTVLRNHIIYYPTPTSLSYFWNFGFLAGLCLVIQIASGLFLAMHYSSDISLAFNSVEHMMRDVNFGWLLRYTHANGASMFLLVIYIHMARGIFYKSYLPPRDHLWNSGVLLFVLLMATAFLGYVLPWGQMSFWGATVITNLASAIPKVGQTIAYWLWGGYAVDNATLTRFFALHFLIPFLMAGLSLIHLTLLHIDGSTNPLGIDDAADYISFYPYFLVKDFFGLFVFLLLFSYLVFFEPNLLGHPDNYIKANPLVTPAHIVPEWYFLPFYAILRAIPDKLGGVLAMGGAIAILFLLPIIDKYDLLKQSTVRHYVRFIWAKISRLISISFWVISLSGFTSTVKYKAILDLSATKIFFKPIASQPNFAMRSVMTKPWFKFFFSLWVLSFLMLGWLGAQPVEYPFPLLSAIMASYYFLFFLSFIF